MKCPICSTWTEVRESRARLEGFVRRRECGNGHRFVTTEVVIQLPRPGRKKKEKQP